MPEDVLSPRNMYSTKQPIRHPAQRKGINQNLGNQKEMQRKLWIRFFLKCIDVTRAGMRRGNAHVIWSNSAEHVSCLEEQGLA